MQYKIILTQQQKEILSLILPPEDIEAFSNISITRLKGAPCIHYLNSCDTSDLDTFIKSCCAIDKDGFIVHRNFYDEFKRIVGYKKSQKVVCPYMSKRGFIADRSCFQGIQKRVWKGIRFLKPEELTKMEDKFNENIEGN